MLTLITGAPGSGKSAALVSLLSELSKDRTIYASGIPDFKVPHEDLDDPTKWPDVVPDGSIVVIDEVQRFWRPRGPGTKVPPDIAALETHRHRGLDFYLVTQAPRLVDSNVRGLVGRHVHLRDLGILGRWWYEWPEVSESCNTSWKNAPIKKRFRLPKSALGLYRSASIHIKPVRSFPFMLVVMVVALVATAGLSWKVYTIIRDKSIVPVASVPSATGVLAGGSHGGAAAPPYDVTSFTPRIPSRPESAPAYDTVRQVVVFPQVAGCVAMPPRCSCFTQQGNDAGLTPSECREWLANPPFNPYRLDPSPPRSSSDKQGISEGRVATSVNPA